MKRACVVIAALSLFASAQTKPVAKAPATKSPAQRAAEANRLNNLGVGYMNQQQFERALKYFQQASVLDPKLEVGRLNQGIALLNMQRPAPAGKILLEIVQHDPRNVRAWYNLGLLYKSEGQAEKALDAFDRVAALDPKDADTLYFIGSTHAELHQYSEAIAAFQKALALNAFHASAEFGLARAYQQSGDMPQARQHLARFQQLRDSKLGAPISVVYGDQGPLSRAEEAAGGIEVVPPPIKVEFVSVGAQAGLKGAGPDVNFFAPETGSGACFLDFDNDGRIDLLLAGGGPTGVTLYRNLGNGKFADVTKAAGLDIHMHGVSCAVGDYDNDGYADFAISLPGRVILYHNEKNGTFKDVTQAAGIHVEGTPLGLTFVDYDHDGDLDLYVTRGVSSAGVAPATNMIWRNNGNGTFSDVSDSIGLAGAAPALGAVGTDYNNDRAIDLVVASAGKSPTIFVNPREGKFPAITPWSTPMPSPVVAVAVLDFNKDGWMDLAFTHSGAPGLSLWRNVDGKNFEPVPLPETHWVRGWGVVALDYDNDGWIDLAAVGETADGHGEIRLFRNLGPQGFKDVTADVGLDTLSLKEPRSLIAGDYDGDGATDLLITQRLGAPVLLRNQGGNQNNWLRIALKGLADNKSGIGGKVEVFAGALHQKFEIQGGSGFLGQNSPYLIAGLGQNKSVDIVRVLWPTGVVQDEVQVASRRNESVNEIDRRGSSCPTLFVWNGKRFELVGDMIGAGVVGHWVAPGERNVPRPTEYIKIDGPRAQLDHGKLKFQFMEPMEEAVYFDQARLLAVDHPADAQVFPNEYFASNPPYPAFKVIASRNAKPPAGAWDDAGHDVLRQLLQLDHQFVTGFELLSFKGYAKLHRLELDLGEPYQGGPLRLLLSGWTDYFSADSMYAASQAGIDAIPPFVEALDSSGQWRRVVDDMGFPAGLPRTMIADLSGKLPVGTRRIRLTTNLQIYWDQVLIDRTNENNVSVRLTPVPLSAASLSFHGYPRTVEGNPPGDLNYVFEDVSQTGPYARQAGSYTRYGDVLPLLTAADDRFVVFGTGDSVALEFDPASLPPLPAGWLRDYFFDAEGYEKDMDFYAAEGNTAEPLPFAQMGGYPYPANVRFPDDDEHVKYLLEYNTRQVSGSDPAGYQFAFPPAKPPR